MRIAMVSEHASPLATLGGVDAGGQNVHVAALSTALARAGHEVDVYTRRDDPDLPECVELAAGVTVVHVAAGPARTIAKDELLPYMDAFGDVLADWWSTRATDVAHAHFWMSGLASLRAAALTGVPVAQTFHALGSVKRRHQGSSDTSPPGRVAAEASIGRRVDVVVATCSDEVTELVRLGVPAERIRVVPCGVDIERFRPGCGGVVEPPRRARYRLVCVGRLVERKGIETVLHALADLPDTELVVAGGPSADLLSADDEARRLLEVAKADGVDDRVHLVGRVDHDDLPALVGSADAVVATPWYEPFGIVPVEAAACGVPVVGSAVGGLVDTVQDGRTGLLVPPRDPAALASALRDLLGHPERRAVLGAAARRRAVARYGWDRIAAQTEVVYQAMVRGAVLTEAAAR
ncbi:glycosyltransferase [Cellulomonas sp. URHD0024]|uniref:glycosyltransferase n=1 Tax=Cellulomonas sp. URHD0024 TaxID=1302620 RepID=UPI000422550C|nr:glycosyltransferase [Cellulomonas sp. URHD0024]